MTCGSLASPKSAPASLGWGTRSVTDGAWSAKVSSVGMAAAYFPGPATDLTAQSEYRSLRVSPVTRPLLSLSLGATAP